MASITANDKPIFCWFGGSDCWGCQDLISWHQNLETAVGLQEANKIFITEWEKAPFINTAYDCRSFNTAFREYAKQKGFFNALYSGFGVIAQPIGVGTDVVSGVGSLISNTSSGISNASKIFKWLLPTLLILGAIGLIVFAVKKYKFI